MPGLVPEVLLPRQLHVRLNPAIPVEWCLELKIGMVLGTMHSVGSAGRAGLKLLVEHQYRVRAALGSPLQLITKGNFVVYIQSLVLHGEQNL